MKPNGPHSPPSFGSSTPNSPDDMNSALLKKSSSTDTDSSVNNNMFGNFRGFSLKPLAQTNGLIGASNIAYVHPVTKIGPDTINGPTKVAPPIPKPPIIMTNNKSAKSPPKVIVKPHNNIAPAVHFNNNGGNFTASEAPALPPLNPGQSGRPIISGPILENSTCNRKELESPLKMATGSDPKLHVQPIRPAPPKPASIAQKQGVNIKAEVLVNPEASNKEKKSKDGQLLNRITSFLKKEEKPIVETVKPAPPKPVLKTNRKPIDRERLKTIEISCPIPIVNDTLDAPVKENEINRTQSMRDSSTLGRRPKNFGASMRQAGKRPTSIVGRPTLPPPPRPASPVKSLSSPKKEVDSIAFAYENPPPPKKVTINDIATRSPMMSPDMAPLAHISEESSPTTPSDNIYDEIAESPSPPNLNSTSTESMGLLGEIVSEIESRNCDAVYIASTLRKGKSMPKKDNLYINTAEITPIESEEEEYTSPKSIASTTSSGYMRPTGFSTTTPIARVAPNHKSSVPYSNSMSSFKSPPNSAGLTSDKGGSIKSPDLNSISFSSPMNSNLSNTCDSQENSSGKIGTVAPSKPESLRTYKPYHTTINRPGPYLASIQAKTGEKPNLPLTKTTVRARTPSPSKANKSIVANGTAVKSPDIIPKTKQPDLINRASNNSSSTPSTTSKPKPVTSKPNLISNKTSNSITNGPKSINKLESKTLNPKSGSTGGTNSTASKILNSVNKTAPGRISHVASLQQKFESGAKK